MQERVLAVDATVIKTRDPDRLFPNVLLLLSTDHMNLAAHLHGAVKCIHGIPTVMLARTVALQLALIDSATGHR